MVQCKDMVTLNTDTNSDSNEIKNWLNEHGYPDAAYLESIAQDGSINSIDKLKSIADDLDIDYASDISAPDLIDHILLGVKQNDGEESDITT